MDGVESGHPSDLTDGQWAVIESLVPSVRTGGRPEKHPRRAIVNAILYVVRAGVFVAAVAACVSAVADGVSGTSHALARRWDGGPVARRVA